MQNHPQGHDSSTSQGRYSSPENKRFAEVARELGRLLRSSTPINWQESRRWCSDVLRPVIHASETSRRLTGILAGRPFIVGGDEHHVVHVESEPDRVYKFTHGDNFGCRPYFSPHDPELTGKHFHGTGNADPFFYLTRWRILNMLSGYKTRFEGFVRPENPNWLPRICISQPKVAGVNPQVSDIRLAMERYGFAEISQDAYLHPFAHALLTDMAPRNVRIVDGIPVPFDAIAMVAPRRVIEWALTVSDVAFD